MKTIKVKVYKFSELSEIAKMKAISDQINFEIEVMNENSLYYELAVLMEKNKTPWFLGEEIYHHYKEKIEEILEINDYWFCADGSFFIEK